MNRKDLGLLAVISIVAAIVSIIASTAIFKTSVHTAQAPNIQTVNSSLPDTKNDPKYNSFFFQGALDPTQPVQIGNSSNNQPF